MTKVSSSLQFFLDLVTTSTVVTRRFDSGLGGLGLTEFLILHALSEVPEGKMRRIDLAEKVGLTASGVTRLLLPMEKIGLVKREAHARDARVSFVVIAPGGKRHYGESLERAELLSTDLIPTNKIKKIEDASKVLKELF